MSALLNALDGAFTPHGLVKFLTTNRRDLLDERVIRPGRVSLELELGPCTPGQLQGLWELAFGPTERRVVPPLAKAVGRAPAEVVDVLLRHLDDPNAAAREFATWRPTPAGLSIPVPEHVRALGSAHDRGTVL
jgi:hypothetical protein